jgi:plastocyanin
VSDVIFYFLGGSLVIISVLLSFVGLRMNQFPSGVEMIAVTPAFAILVVATLSFAVINARAEQRDHREELAAEAAEEQEAEGEQGATGATGATGPTGVAGAPGATGATGEAEAPPSPGGEEAVLQISSPADGSLVFDPDTLTVFAGEVTIEYDNPSPVPHNVAIESEKQGLIAESDTSPNAVLSVSAELDAGDYTFFCSVPGHREAGMFGDLSVE